MRKLLKKTLSISLTVYLMFCIFSQSRASIDGSFQYWNTETLSWKMHKKIDVKLEEEFRFGEKASSFYYQHSDIGITYEPYNWLDLGLSYRHILEDKQGDWQTENRPHLNVSLKALVFKRIKLKNRIRLEYRLKKAGSQSYRGRDKVSLTVPFQIKKVKLEPYVADEVFFDFEENGFNHNRLYAGIGISPYKHIKIDIFYLLQSSEKKKVWQNTNVLGSKINIPF